MKFRKKFIVEAKQFFPDKKPWPEGVRISFEAQDGEEDGYAIDTLEGTHIANPGDWIITGVKGEKYPCKPDIFVATYEKVKTP